MEDEMKELRRIWDSLESQLAGMSGDIERKYTTYFPDGRPTDTITISSDADGDDIIASLIEVGYLRSDGDYSTVYDGKDDEIEIEETFNDDVSTALTLKTNEEIEDFDQFMENVLDIERTQYLSGRDGWVTKEYTIVIGTGGPHIEFTTNYAINVYWAGKRIEDTTGDNGARRTIDRIEEYLNEIYQD